MWLSGWGGIISSAFNGCKTIMFTYIRKIYARILQNPERWRPLIYNRVARVGRLPRLLRGPGCGPRGCFTSLTLAPSLCSSSPYLLLYKSPGMRWGELKSSGDLHSSTRTTRGTREAAAEFAQWSRCVHQGELRDVITAVVSVLFLH